MNERVQVEVQEFDEGSLFNEREFQLQIDQFEFTNSNVSIIKF